MKAGDAFDEAEVGGRGRRGEPSAGDPVRVTGTVLSVAEATAGRGGGDVWLCVGFGQGNVLVLSPYLVQIMEPSELWTLGLEASGFRRGSDQVPGPFPPGF